MNARQVNVYNALESELLGFKFRTDNNVLENLISYIVGRQVELKEESDEEDNFSSTYWVYTFSIEDDEVIGGDYEIYFLKTKDKNLIHITEISISFFNN